MIPELEGRRIEAHLRFLSSDLLEGRGVGSRGGRIGEEYIRATFAAAGLQPVPDLGFRQEVPMIGVVPVPELRFTTSAGESFSPRYRDGFVLEAGVPEANVEVNAELVFVGYGITAPEYDWDDFAGVDVTGKLLLVRVNDPGTPSTPDFFQGRALTYYGRWTYKFEEAARRGAAGVILIHTDASAGYAWPVVRNSNTGEQFGLAGVPEFPLGVRGWVTEAVGDQLLAASGEKPEVLIAASDRRGFRVRSLGVTVNATVRSTIREVRTANVMAMIPGDDPGLVREPVIFMAHHDHLGRVETPEGPVIYPGAYDNASGVALLLAMAEAFMAGGVSIRRPFLFLASTAEESGLLGSEWYTRHPAFPLGRTAAVLNVDGANLWGPTGDIAPLGVDRSSLGGLVREAAGAEGLVVAPEQNVEQGMFFRQDHFPFARAGVPAVAFDHGLSYLNRPEGWGQAQHDEYISNAYHQPADAFREDFDYRGAVQQGRIIMRVAVSVSNGKDLPDWCAGSEFQRR
ncbi:MAG: M28 family peptidase [Gemmatimonadota bacterium]|jgi:Zn-dependent M28 family amino/carboxypeptidase|nr:M28 family peptidase [Gemmatimonadota bacterium]